MCGQYIRNERIKDSKGGKVQKILKTIKIKEEEFDYLSTIQTLIGRPGSKFLIAWPAYFMPREEQLSG